MITNDCFGSSSGNVIHSNAFFHLNSEIIMGHYFCALFVPSFFSITFGTHCKTINFHLELNNKLKSMPEISLDNQAMLNNICCAAKPTFSSGRDCKRAAMRSMLVDKG